MVITGSAIFCTPGSGDAVVEGLKRHAAVTLQAQSDSGNEIIINLEADNPYELELLCAHLKEEIPQIIDISHIYMNIEDEVEKMVKQSEDE